MKLMKRYPGCFVCGDKNPIGLGVPFYFNGDEVVAEYTAGRDFEGYKDVLHGGILSALLDEVMIRSILALDIYCVTSEIRVKFKKMVKTGDKLSLVGRLVEDKGRILAAEGRITNQQNDVVAEGEAKFFRVDGEMQKQLAQELE
jgi:uncharacterized protein (TIGR00369 family)